ncbi:hypothetical protein RhiLY_11043 [Ceratobasidium sp. AG-Ba]|nr:hypothetical protein RhiLY_11043 [Ceratobasidium sp. AG-Ba]
MSFVAPAGPATAIALEHPALTPSAVPPPVMPIPMPMPTGAATPQPAIPAQNPVVPPTPWDPNQRKNKEPEPGVWEINVKAHRPDGQLRVVTIRTDTSWDDFCSAASGALGLDPKSNVFEVQCPRAKSQKWILIVDSDGWAPFAETLPQYIQTARSNPVEIEVKSKSASTQNKGSAAGKARSREDDVPVSGAATLSAANRMSFAAFKKIKDRVGCAECSKSGTHKYCLVRKNGKHTELSLEFISKWVHEHLEGKASEFSPPDYLLEAAGLKRTPAGLVLACGLDDSLSGSESEPNFNTSLFSSLPPLSHPQPLSSPDLPDSHNILQVLAQKETKELLIVYPTITEALAALDATKPDHHFPLYLEQLNSCGFRYVDEVGKVSLEQFSHLTEIFGPIAREIYDYATCVTRHIKRESIRFE